MKIEEVIARALCKAWGNHPDDQVRMGSGTYLDREMRVVAKVIPEIEANGLVIMRKS